MTEVEEIKRKIDIVDLVSGYLTLKKAGVNYRGLCPFHQEKTGSFMVSQEKQIFKCFGCSEGGDIFEFVMKMENMEFREALEILAAKAGVQLEKKDAAKVKVEQEKAGRKTRLFQVNNLSSQFFYKILTDHELGKPALEYLKKRGLTKETIEEFQIGYAPSPEILRKWLKQKGFNENEIQLAGGPDRFYRRIVFPIRDVMGNTVGFTGRVIDSNMEPKYLNTPETDIFHKGRLLYNLDKARGEIKLEDNAVIVEGQMDVIASYQAGVKNVIASSGTALTPDHLLILYRYTPNITFCFDSDNAGLITSKKAYEMAIIQGSNAKMINIEGFKDPGEIAIQEPEKWREIVLNRKPVIDWYFDVAFKEKGEGESLSSQTKKEIAKELLPIINKIPDIIEQAHYVGILARRLDVSEKVVFQALEKVKFTKLDESKKVRIEENKKMNEDKKPVFNFEEILIGLLFIDPSKTILASKVVKKEDFDSLIFQQVYIEFEKCYNKNIKEAKKYLAQVLDANTMKKLELLSFEVEKKFLVDTPIDQLVVDLSQKIRHEKNEFLKNKYAKAIKEAEVAGNTARLRELIKEFQDAIAK